MVIQFGLGGLFVGFEFYVGFVIFYLFVFIWVLCWRFGFLLGLEFEFVIWFRLEIAVEVWLDTVKARWSSRSCDVVVISCCTHC